MELINRIISKNNLNDAFKKVVSNRGVAGVDKMTVFQVEEYLRKNNKKIINDILNKKYYPMPVKRVYIPKENGDKRPLGIPTVVDRIIQQAVAKPISDIYENVFSDYSYGFRPNRSCHDAINKSLEYLSEGYEWVIDIDIEKFFDKVNHDKLIQILREQVKDSITLNLIRKYLRAGVLENGVFAETKEGVPQGGPLSVVLANVYLDKLDKELENRGLRFARYADDVVIFVKSEKAADRVLKSISSWIERKFFLKVSATKSKVVKPTDSKFLGFTFIKYKGEWKVKPLPEKVAKFKKSISSYLKRNKACARSFDDTIIRLNQMLRGWINYYKTGMMKTEMKKLGEWIRHKLRVIIIKQWKRPRTIYKNLMYLNKRFNCNFDDESIFKVANSRLGLYKQCSMNVVNFIISPKLLETKTKDRPALVNPLRYYLR